MASGNSTVENFTSDPVIIETPNAEKASPEVGINFQTVVPPNEDDKFELKHGGCDITFENPHERVRERRVIYPRDYSRSRSPVDRVEAHPRPIMEINILSNTASLNIVLEAGDTCIETLKGRLVYVTSHDFHTADLQKLSWLFQFGVQESWIQKPTTFLPGNAMQFDLPNRQRGRVDYYDDDFDRYDNGPRGGPVPIARLGSALRIFKDDSQTSKVKFVTVVSAKNDSNWVKMTISHSRQAATTEICHAMLNNLTIVFVGAVLKNVPIPAENPNKKARKLQRVGSIQEAEEVDQGVVGIIC